jgi:hypothetical protein
MITDLEEAVAAVITAALADDASIAAVPYVVRSSTTREEVPGNASVIAVRMQQGDRTMVALLDGIAEIFVATPANNEETSVAGHRLLEQALDRVFSPGTTIGEDEAEQSIAAALSDEIEARITGYTGAGFFNQGWQPAREETYFQPSLTVKIGAVRD